GQVLQLPGFDVVEQFLTRVPLEGVRRVAGLQPVGEQCPGLLAAPTGHRGVDELRVRILLREDPFQLGQALALTGAGPPGEDLDRAGVAVTTLIVVTARGDRDQGRCQHRRERAPPALAHDVPPCPRRAARDEARELGQRRWRRSRASPLTLRRPYPNKALL